MSAAAAVAGLALREALRRRVFAVVLVLTVAFLGLYWLAVSTVFGNLDDFAGDESDPVIVAGATLLGLASFATLFLGTVLGIFLTLSAIRGDAERGLLQPVVVRPVGRNALLLARFAGAAAVAAAYVAAVFALAAAITSTAGSWTPDRVLAPAAGLALAVTILVALSMLGSTVLSATANGIAIFMLFGAGLTAGLLGQIGEALASDSLSDVARAAAWLLPFEALYQQALSQLTADTAGTARVIVQLGPFGGAKAGGALLLPWCAAYLAGILALAAALFRRRDL